VSDTTVRDAGAGLHIRKRPTVPPGMSTRPSRAALWSRRLLVAGLLVLVVVGAAGLLGVRTGHATARGSDGLEIRLDYARTSRPGLASPWTLTVSRPDGFDGPIHVATTESYLRAFDTNAVNPEPDGTTSRGDTVEWTFDPPPGDTLRVSLDAMIEPGVQWRRQATTTVSTGGAAAEVAYTTWVMP
jgi:hypothetical protein